MKNINKQFLSVKQLSETTGLSASTVYQAVEAGTIPCMRFGRRILFDLDTVCRHMESRSREPRGLEGVEHV